MGTQQTSGAAQGVKTKMARVLIVDDDREVVEMLREAFTNEGYEVETATQSLRVYDAAREFHPDLMLLDIMMPYLDGWDELRLFALDPDLKDVPVIVVTGDPSAQVPEGQTVADFIYKPFDLDDLLDRVGQALAVKSRG